MVPRDKHRPFFAVISKNPALRRLVDKASELSTLNDTLRGYLSPFVARHCHVGNWDKGILTLSTTSPAWKHHIRFYHMDLLKRLKQTPVFQNLKTIRIIVTPELGIDKAITDKNDHLPPPVPISPETVSYIQLMTDYIDCPKLKASLLKLSQHAVHRQEIQQRGYQPTLA